VAVYETKSFSRAAELLHTTPSSVSYNVKELERQLGIRFFIPHTRGVDPTKEADAFYEHVFSGLSSLLDAENLARAFRGLEIGNVRIGCSSIIANFFLAEFLMRFGEQFPKIRFEFFGDSKDGYFHSLIKRDIDLMLTFSSDINKKNPNFTTVELMKIENCFFTSKSFAKEHGIEDSIPLAKLLSLPLVLLSKRLGTMKKLDEKLGIKLEPILEAPTTELMMSHIQHGRGIGYGSKDFIEAYPNMVKIEIQKVVLPYTSVEMSYSEAVINKAAQEFINQLIKYCNDKSATLAGKVLKSGVDKLSKPDKKTHIA